MVPVASAACSVARQAALRVLARSTLCYTLTGLARRCFAWPAIRPQEAVEAVETAAATLAAPQERLKRLLEAQVG